MMISRINQLRQAHQDLEHKLQWRPEELAAPANVLIELLIDMSKSPVPVSSAQYRAELHQMQLSGTYLLGVLHRFLVMENKLKEIYQCVQNPLELSNCIASAFCYPDDEFCLSMASEALDLGGILSSKFASNSYELSNPQSYRVGKAFPPVEIIKGTLSNRLENEWAIEHNAKDSFRYCEHTALLLAMVADEDPEWAIRFLLEHEEHLIELFDPLPNINNDPIAKILQAVFRGTLTAKPFAELHRQRPEYFDLLVNARFLEEHIQKTLPNSPGFKLSEIPVTEAVFDLNMSYWFLKCVINGSLTPERKADMGKAWNQYGLKGDIAVEVMKSKISKKMLAFVKPYYEFIRTPELSAESIMKSSGDYRDINEHFEALDAFLNKPGKRLADDPIAMENHAAYLLASTNVDVEHCRKTQVTVKTLEVSLLQLQAQDRHKSDALLDFVRLAVMNKQDHPEVAKLSNDFYLLLRTLLPKLDVELLRTIKWKDGVTKAGLLEDALGL
jgi:hypothetical protein